jgi:PEP-CTERM motif-containing protein
MRIVRLLALLVLVGSIPVAVGAEPIVAGDIVRFSDLPGNTGGGEFKLTDVANPSEWIITFCLQKTEYMNFTNNFIVGSVNPYTLTDPNDKGGVNGQDPISSQTAWLYTQFTDGTLANYAYANTATGVFANREASANALQHAFWMFEQEEALDPYNYYVQLALQNTPSNFGTGYVGVLNLFLYDPTKQGGLGPEAQDQLTRVPEPTTLALVGAGLLGMAVRRRRAKA